MFQLFIGDSHSVRFHKFLKTRGHKDVDIFAAKGGLTVEEGRQLIKSFPLNNKRNSTVFLSLGSNDILKQTYDPNVTHGQFKSVVRLIKQRIAPEQLFIFKVPLFPRIRGNQVAINNVHKLNAYISTFNAERIHTVNIPGITDRVTPVLFQPYFYNGKPDLIHLNELGYKKVVQAIKQYHYNSF